MRAIALALALTACTVAGPLPSPPQPVWPVEVPQVDTPRPASRLGSVRAADGSALPLNVWDAPQPRAVILGVHGFGDYGPSTFAAPAVAWAARGITTYAYDQRGFGRGASRGLWPGAQGLVDDLASVSAQIRARHPCLPLTVLGHSMGGGVTLAAAAAPGFAADRLVLAAPAIWGGAWLNPLQRVGAWGLAAVVPDTRFTGRGVVRIQASDNLAALRWLGVDPLYLRAPSARELMGLVRVTDLAEAAAPRVALPSLLLLGARDQIVPERAVRGVFATLAGPRQIKLYPDGWHLLLRDLQAAPVWADVADWALAAPPPPGCPRP